jgi:serine/threonine-protein kinase
VNAEGPLREATETPTQVTPGVSPVSDDAATLVDGGVLAGEEMRTRTGALRALFIALVVFILGIAVVLDKTVLTWVLIGVYAAAAAVVAGLIVLSRKRQYGNSASTVIGATLVLLVLGSCLYFGVIGGPAIILPALVYYYGLGNSKSRRRWVAGIAIGGEALLTLLAAAGIVPPTGMIPALAILRGDYILLSGFSIVTLLMATYWLSSLSRRSTLLAMAELERARRDIQQRDALLDEARDDFDRVVGRARMGRMTGRIIDGFQLGSVIGRGAMGDVYVATAQASGQKVAFKVLHPHLSESKDQVTRFFREAQITAGLDSPHIPKLYASGTATDGAPYLALELLHGQDLAGDLRQRTSLSLEEIDFLVEQVCRALHAAHQAGVIHRDVKPQNLFLTLEPEVGWKVLDFGVSMITSGTGTLTQGAAVGTPAYMAPEQALSTGIDERADVFSLGAVVYRALTGRPAFSGTSNAAIVFAAIRHQPIRPGELVELAPDIDAFIALSLAKKANLRVGSAKEFASSWKAAREHRLSAEQRTAAQLLLRAHPWGSDYAATEQRTTS